MALSSSSGIYFYPEDDLPPPNDPLYNLHPGQPPFVGAPGVNNFHAIPINNSRQWAPQTYPNYPIPLVRQQVFLPLVQVSYKCRILTTTARTTLTQTFYHPGNRPISKATYMFPLYANCSVVSFVCRVGESKVITGVVKPKDVAKEMYESAASSGQMAGLLEYNTPDVFTTSIGNIPAGVKIKVEIGYILELQHDAEVDGIKFTVPLSIAPRYGPPPPGAFGQNGPEVSVDKSLRMEIEVTMGEAIKSVGSPSHLTTIQLGQLRKGKGKAKDQEHDPKKALVTLSQTPAELLKDFVLLITTITPHFISTPQALLETHPTIAGHQALKVTLVPRFKMPRTKAPEKTEIIFIIDRSGSMRDTIGDVKSALRVFLKSLPLGCFFNIISFGSQCTLLWERSRAYTEETLKIASEHIETFDASYGGTELIPPLMQAFSQRHSEPGMCTEVMILTDGEIWRLPELLEYIQQSRKESGGAIRLFSLGVGDRVSHALVQGIATAGGGYSQIVSSGETGHDRLANGMEAKVVRMLNCALTDHIEEYKLHVLHEEGDEEDSQSEDEEEEVGPREQMASINPAPVQVTSHQEQPRRISLFDPTEVPRQRSPTPPDTIPTSILLNCGDTGNRFAHLKRLQGPEVIQTPFEIPPLFPYKRSVVYLLIPPTTKQFKYAKSVTLSATTITGDRLSLSIPITRIEQPGKTVHQLAARMLLRDLEEGRSWLHSGKYGVTTETHEYTQAEGERVGMRWSLASKWTSFVGIEEEILDEDLISTPVTPARDLPELFAGRSSASHISSGSPEASTESKDSMSIDTSASSSRFDHMPSSSPTHPPPTTVVSVPRSVLTGARMMGSGVDTMSRLLEPRDTPNPMHPVWNHYKLHHSQSPPPRTHGVTPWRTREYLEPQPLQCMFSEETKFTRATLAPPPHSTPSSGGPHSKTISHQHGGFGPANPAAIRENLAWPPSYFFPPRASAPAPKSSTSAAPAAPPPTSQSTRPSLGLCCELSYEPALLTAPAAPPIDIYRLIAAQEFDGSFPITDTYVVELLGYRMDLMPESWGGDKVAWVALLIAVLLERKCSHLRDVWELVVRKIWVFLKGREGVNVEEAKVVAEELVSG